IAGDRAEIVHRALLEEHTSEGSAHRRAGLNIDGVSGIAPGAIAVRSVALVVVVVVVPVQVTVVLLTGDAGVQSAAARSMCANDAVSGASVTTMRAAEAPVWRFDAVLVDEQSWRAISRLGKQCCRRAADKSSHAGEHVLPTRGIEGRIVDIADQGREQTV